MESNTAVNNFSWYTGSNSSSQVPQNTSDQQFTSIPIGSSNSGSNAQYPLSIGNLSGLPNDGRPITINAQNVYIEDDSHSKPSSTTTMNTKTVDGDKKESTTVSKVESNKNADGSHPPSKTTDVTNATKEEAEKAASKDASASKDTHKSENENPLGIPAPGRTAATTDASAAAPVTAAAPLVGPHPAVAGAAPANTPNGPVAPSTAPTSATTLKDGVHDTPLSTGTATDRTATTQPLSSAPSTSSTLPNGSAHPADSKENKDKKKKEHKSIKQKFHDWKVTRKSGGVASATGDVHPKDSRDGKELPSENELATKYMNLGGENQAESTGNGLPKDKLDATGKTVTGSDANPSKASNPFHAPLPTGNGAPVESK